MIAGVLDFTENEIESLRPGGLDVNTTEFDYANSPTVSGTLGQSKLAINGFPSTCFGLAVAWRS